MAKALASKNKLPSGIRKHCFYIDNQHACVLSVYPDMAATIRIVVAAGFAANRHKVKRPARLIKKIA